MATYIRKLKDASGNTILPATRVNGVFTANNTRLDTYLSNMESSLNSKIEAAKTNFASANATASQVLEGRTFYAQNKTLKTGTMPSRITVGKNGVVGISSVHPNVPVSRGSNCQLNVNTSGEEWLSIGVPEGYYNGVSSSYVGVPTSHAKSALDWPTERGQYQYATQLGSGTEGDTQYISLSGIPEGIYRSNGDAWAPEVRYDINEVANFIKAAGKGGYTLRNIPIPADNIEHTININPGDGNGNYSWVAIGYMTYGNENSLMGFYCQDICYETKRGAHQTFMLTGTHYFDQNSTIRAVVWGGNIFFHYVRVG